MIIHSGEPIFVGFTPEAKLVSITTAVKRLNRYFRFLLLRFHLPVREKWAEVYKSVTVVNIIIFPFFSKF